MDSQTQKKRGKLLQIAIIAVVFGLATWQLVRAGFDWRLALENSNPWLFFVAMASLPVFGFPISVCYIFAGLAFPPPIAIACCLGALAINMSASYVLANTVFKGPIEAFIAARKWKVPEIPEKNKIKFALLIRVIPGPPYFVQNLVISLSGLPFPTYLWTGLLTQGGIGILMILCTRYLSHETFSTGGIIAMTVIGVIILLKIAQILRKRYLAKSKAKPEAT